MMHRLGKIHNKMDPPVITTKPGEINRGILSQEYPWMMEYKNKSKDSKAKIGTNSNFFAYL